MTLTDSTLVLVYRGACVTQRCANLLRGGLRGLISPFLCGVKVGILLLK